MIVVVPVDPPGEGSADAPVVEETPLAADEWAALYEAAVTDVVRAVAGSGGDLLAYYRDEETLPASADVDDPESAVRDLVTAAIDDAEAVRFERQVGSTRSARVGNAVTHLLEREDATSVAVLEPTAPLVRRTEIDGAAMSLRRNDVVLGPDASGGVYLACFAEPVDFADAYRPPELPRLARRGADAGSVGFAPMVPTLADASGLATTVAAIEARSVAGRPVPAATAAAIDELGIEVDESGTVSRT